MKYKALVTQQVELLIEKCGHIINAVDGGKLTKEELIRQIDTIKRGLERIQDEIGNEDNPPITFQ